MTELQLCRDVYHCLPSQLAQEDAVTLLRHMAVMEAENTVSQHRKRAAAQRNNRKR